MELLISKSVLQLEKQNKTEKQTQGSITERSGKLPYLKWLVYLDVYTIPGSRVKRKFILFLDLKLR